AVLDAHAAPAPPSRALGLRLGFGFGVVAGRLLGRFAAGHTDGLAPVDVGIRRRGPRVLLALALSSRLGLLTGLALELLGALGRTISGHRTSLRRCGVYALDPRDYPTSQGVASPRRVVTLTWPRPRETREGWSGSSRGRWPAPDPPSSTAGGSCWWRS